MLNNFLGMVAELMQVKQSHIVITSDIMVVPVEMQDFASLLTEIMQVKPISEFTFYANILRIKHCIYTTTQLLHIDFGDGLWNMKC